MKIDIRRMIADFGGAAALAAALGNPAEKPATGRGQSEHGGPCKAVSPAAIYKWQARGSIPGAYIERIAHLARVSGRVFDLNDYLVDGASRGSHTGMAGHLPVARSDSDMGSLRKIRIHDVSVCECEHGLGAPIDARSKALIAQKLDKLGVDIIEAAFIALLPKQVRPVKKAVPENGAAAVDTHDAVDAIDTAGVAVQAIAAVVGRAQISIGVPADAAAVTRAVRMLSAVPHARRRIVIVLPSSALRLPPASGWRPLAQALLTACPHVAAVEVSFEGITAFTADLARWIERCIEQGAETITLSDSEGRQLPEKMGELIRAARARVKNADKVVWSVRCQNDLGLAAANSLAALRAGAGQVQCSMSGLGQRAGMAPLEEVAMAIQAYPQIFNACTSIDSSQLAPASRLIAMITGCPVPANKALIGSSVFDDACRRLPENVLPAKRPLSSRPDEAVPFIDPGLVGWGEPEARIGHLSGRSAFKDKLDSLGIRLGSEEDLSKAFFRFKDLARRKREIFDEDIYALFLGYSADANADAEVQPYRLVAHKVIAETGEMPFASVVLCRDETELRAEAGGSGSIDALFRALEQIVASGGELISYSVNAVTRGSDSQAEVTVRLKYAGYLYCGLASDTDTIAASAEAYLAAVNRILGLRGQIGQGGQEKNEEKGQTGRVAA